MAYPIFAVLGLSGVELVPVLLYLVCVIAIIVYVLRLLGRFVNAHEKMAASLDIIARKLKDDAKP